MGSINNLKNIRLASRNVLNKLLSIIQGIHVSIFVSKCKVRSFSMTHHIETDFKLTYNLSQPMCVLYSVHIKLDYNIGLSIFEVWVRSGSLSFMQILKWNIHQSSGNKCSNVLSLKNGFLIGTHLLNTIKYGCLILLSLYFPLYINIVITKFTLIVSFSKK